MVVVVFLLFCGLHNEAGDSKFRKGRQYIAYVGHVGGLEQLHTAKWVFPSKKKERNYTGGLITSSKDCKD